MATVDANYVCESLIEVKTGVDSGLKLESFIGNDNWEDENWDRLVNQMSVDELAILLEDCGYGTPAIEKDRLVITPTRRASGPSPETPWCPSTYVWTSPTP